MSCSSELQSQTIKSLMMNFQLHSRTFLLESPGASPKFLSIINWCEESLESSLKMTCQCLILHTQHRDWRIPFIQNKMETSLKSRDPNNWSTRKQVSSERGPILFLGVNICRYQYIAGGRKKACFVKQPLWVSIFAWSLILLGSVGLLVVSNNYLPTYRGKDFQKKLRILFSRHHHCSSGCLCLGLWQVSDSHAAKSWTLIKVLFGSPRPEFSPPLHIE